MSDRLTWDDTYAIARALMIQYADTDFQSISLNDIYTWTTGLADFDDDPALSNDAILMAIYTEWYEEANS